MLRDNPELLNAVEIFKERFHNDPCIAAFAPGRVNFIGEHTDYNEGYVLPFALPLRTIVVGIPTKTGVCRAYSTNQHDEGILHFVADSNLKSEESHRWLNYVKGVVFQYLDDLPKGFGFDCVITSNVPMGCGLGSSAALKVAIATFLEAAYEDLPFVTDKERALRCQTAEQTFAGTPCGIMDQYISIMAVKGNMMLLDCRSKLPLLIPFHSGDVRTETVPVIVLTNSHVKHDLARSEYPQRVFQCQVVTNILQNAYPQEVIGSLRDVNIEQLVSIKHRLTDSLYSRAKHVIKENKRVLETVTALSCKDYSTVGKLLNQSHTSLRDDYDVSCREIEEIINIASQLPGVFGCRMIGGGFGGCIITLVASYGVAALLSRLDAIYFSHSGKKCTSQIVEPSNGSGTVILV